MPSKEKINLSLTHDGKNWIATNDIYSLEAKELDELDIKLEKSLAESGLYQVGTKIKVEMNFDNRTIPEWFRQYSNHYFNRIVNIIL